MNKTVIALAIGATLAAPVASADVELLGKAVVLYGKLHGSADYYDRGSETGAIPEPTGVEMTSNASRIGFKGDKELASGVKGTWMFESEIDISGESGTLAARDRYAGVGGVWGSIVLGIHDTPLKSIGGNYTLFGDTVGDYRSILGQVSSNDNQFNQRAKSMAMYQLKVVGLSAALMYSPDFEDVNDPDTGTSGIKNKLVGAGLGYKIGGFEIGAAYEQQENIDNTAGKDASGVRVGVKYKIAGLQVGGVIESLKDDGYGVRIARNAYAAHVAYTIAGFTVGGQYMKAMESDLAAGSDGADQYTVGVSYSFDKKLQVYLAYATLENDTNGSFQLARSGHGQAFAPTQAGEKVTATSLGVVYNF